MKPYDKLTIVRNRQRARDLRVFRELVEVYFARAAYATDGLPVDWAGAQAIRAQINRMLPRVIQVVHAAGVGASPIITDPRLTVGDVEVLRDIFTARHAEEAGQEILDVIDMALGVYEDTRLLALARTVNPFHYAVTALAFVARLPGRAISALGLWPRRPRTPRLRTADLARLEAAAARLANAEQVIETQFAELRSRLAQQLAGTNGQLTELAERLDFAERVLAQQPDLPRLKAPEQKDAATPA